MAGVLLAGTAGATEPEETFETGEPIYGISAVEEVGFSPDRPGIGDSTATVNPGHLVIEGGLSWAPEPLVLGTSGVVGRIGVVDFLEARIRAPDLSGGSGLAVGPVGLGAKAAVGSGRWAFSAVPELTWDPDEGVLGGSFGANGSVGVGPVGFWVHATGSIAQQSDPGLLIGGGISAEVVGPLGVFGHGGGTVDDSAFAGAGFWYRFPGAAQIDAGCDLIIADDTATPVVGLGASFGI